MVKDGVASAEVTFTDTVVSREIEFEVFKQLYDMIIEQAGRIQNYMILKNVRFDSVAYRMEARIVKEKTK